MIKINLKQLLITSNERRDKKSDTLTQRFFTIGIAIEKDVFELLISRLETAQDMSDEKMKNRLTGLIDQMKNAKPNPINGLYMLESWFDENLITGIIINDTEYPGCGGYDNGFVVMNDIYAYVSVKIIKKKDGTTALSVFPQHIWEEKSVKKENTKSKK